LGADCSTELATSRAFHVVITAGRQSKPISFGAFSERAKADARGSENCVRSCVTLLVDSLDDEAEIHARIAHIVKGAHQEEALAIGFLGS
jgi:hypothetical protein